MLAQTHGKGLYLPVVQVNDFLEEERRKILLVKVELCQVEKRVSVAEPAEVNPVTVLSVGNQVARSEVSVQAGVRVRNVGKDGEGVLFGCV